MTENIEYYRNQVTIARTEIKNLRQQLAALKQEHLKEIKHIKSTLNELRCAQCSEDETIKNKEFVCEKHVSLIDDNVDLSCPQCFKLETSQHFLAKCTFYSKFRWEMFETDKIKEELYDQDFGSIVRYCRGSSRFLATTFAKNLDSQPSTSTDTNTSCINYQPIGTIETMFQNKRGVPRQPSIFNAKGTIVIDPSVFNNPEHALSGLEEFSHLWIIFHFHAIESTNILAKVTPPRLGGEKRGVFSTRAPHRPCPIGLSLVKIQSIDGNKVHFLGVDMVNGTPVLDIKPYIPQYDYPCPSFSETEISLERPPTEGISDAAETLASIQVSDDNIGARSLTPQETDPITINTSSPYRLQYGDQFSPGDHENVITPISQSPDSPLSADMLDGSYRAALPTRRPGFERGAPDGQERYYPPAPQSAQVNIPHDGIRVPQWMLNAVTPLFNVTFTDDALVRLRELIGDRAEGFKHKIQSLLTCDPRSLYVRSRYPDHEYNCVLEDVSIGCVFDSNAMVCTIVSVRNPDDFESA